MTEPAHQIEAGDNADYSLTQEIQPASILIVDDEESIRKTLQGVLSDEGYHTMVAGDGVTALGMLRTVRPSVVLLDIWMAGMDGIEVLSNIKQTYRDLPVIMMSGHATIATAVRATQLGALDFIEKPLDLNVTLQAVRRALEKKAVGDPWQVPSQPSHTVEGSLEFGSAARNISGFNKIAFSNHAWAGRAIPQRTLLNSAILYGQGLHSGTKSGLILEPLPPNSGLHFMGVSETTVVPAHLDFVDSTGFATTIRLGQTQAGTIEHLLSALHAYGISNLLIKCNGEVPVLDGSARDFCALFDEVGLEEQDGEWYEIEIRDQIRIGQDREFIQLEPYHTFCVDYTLHYPEPIGTQRYVFHMEDVESFKREIAPARTFGFVKDVGMLQKQGLALGGRFDNFVLIGDKGAINVALRFVDEPVRHKILDVIGDLYLLGRRIRGKVSACMTGHSDNIALLRALSDRLKAC